MLKQPTQPQKHSPILAKGIQRKPVLILFAFLCISVLFFFSIQIQFVAKDYKAVRFKTRCCRRCKVLNKQEVCGVSLFLSIESKTKDSNLLLAKYKARAHLEALRKVRQNPGMRSPGMDHCPCKLNRQTAPMHKDECKVFFLQVVCVLHCFFFNPQSNSANGSIDQSLAVESWDEESQDGLSNS